MPTTAVSADRTIVLSPTSPHVHRKRLADIRRTRRVSKRAVLRGAIRGMMNDGGSIVRRFSQSIAMMRSMGQQISEPQRREMLAEVSEMLKAKGRRF